MQPTDEELINLALNVICYIIKQRVQWNFSIQNTRTSERSPPFSSKSRGIVIDKRGNYPGIQGLMSYDS